MSRVYVDGPAHDRSSRGAGAAGVRSDGMPGSRGATARLEAEGGPGGAPRMCCGGVMQRVAHHNSSIITTLAPATASKAKQASKTIQAANNTISNTSKTAPIHF